MRPQIRTIESKGRRRAAQALAAGTLALLLGACGSLSSRSQPPAAAASAGSTIRRAAPPVSAVAPSLPPAGSGRGGYYQDDGPGDKIPEDLSATPDAQPEVEPYGTRGNRPYVVFGKTYVPILNNRPFKQRGRGSWYGKKFHGQRTSSGERYDMYKMTAAHPTLPIPSYVRVTNLANGKQVIVRVNDRGPFHGKRIIDLSYTAALKLGYLRQGSAELEVERLLPDDIARINAAKSAAASQAPASVAGTPADAVKIAEAIAPAATQSTQAPQPAAVTVLAVPAVSVVPASAGAASQPAAPAGGFYLQLGAYAQAASAEAARSRLQKQWAGALPPMDVVAQGGWFRLMSGPFAGRAEATAAAQTIRHAGAAQPLIVQK